MSSVAIAGIAFGFVFGGAMIGVILRATLPKEQLVPESRDVVKLAMGVIATMTAVVLGMLVASAKGYYDTQSRELTEMSSKIVLLDRILAHYGPEAKEARDALRGSVEDMLDTIWSNDAKPSKTNPGGAGKMNFGGAGEALYDRIQNLTPQNDTQRSLQGRAINLAVDVGQTRLLMYEQATTSISLPLLLVVVFSLSITFASFNLHASPNSTLIVTLVLCALSVAGTLFLVLEMYTPFHGMIQIPADPLRNALAQLGR
jgi:hypothetical protein